MAELQWGDGEHKTRVYNPQLSPFVRAKNERDQQQGQWVIEQKEGFAKREKLKYSWTQVKKRTHDMPDEPLWSQKKHLKKVFLKDTCKVHFSET